MPSSFLYKIPLQIPEMRALTRNDIPQVLELERLGYSHPWTEGVFQDCFKDAYRLWALARGADLLGYAVVNYIVDEAHLLNICIHPRLRQQGLGRQLLRQVLKASRNDGMSQIILEVRASHEAAAMLYLDEGFQEIGCRPDYYPAANGREDARVMVYRFT